MSIKTTKNAIEEGNFTFSLLKPILVGFSSAIEKNCLDRKMVLTRLFEIEIERLDESIREPVPIEVMKRVREMQRHSSLKSSWTTQQVMLPKALGNKINKVCKAKNVVRDAWINRVLMLTTAPKLTAMFGWDTEYWESLDYFEDKHFNSKEYIQVTTHTLSGEFDPLWSLHAAINDQSSAVDPFMNHELYKRQLFRMMPEPLEPRIKPASTSSANEKQTYMRHQLATLAWCLTCWAEPEDLKAQDDYETLFNSL